MPQRKPVIVRSSKHVDGIREMMEFVRKQQEPTGEEIVTSLPCTDLRMKRHVLLPGIGEQQHQAHNDHSDGDPAYESDELNDDFMGKSRTPSPPIRNCSSALSSKSSHNISLSKSLDMGSLGRNKPVRVNRKSSLGDPDAVMPIIRTLPPVMLRSSSKVKTRSSIPSLDLSTLTDNSDDEVPVAHRPTAPSPTRSDNSLEDGGPVDYIES